MRWQARRGRVVSHLLGADLEARFSRAYQEGAWLIEDEQESRSGRGSSLAATVDLRNELPELLSSLGCSRLLDLGCGDFNWMRGIDLPCDYIGVDIVPALVDTLSTAYASPRRRFVALNACEDPLPNADVVLCREMLFHLSYLDVVRVLTNVRNSSAKYFIATTNQSVRFNSDIPSGAFREINLERRPFALPRPNQIIRDEAVALGRALAVWDVSAL